MSPEDLPTEITDRIYSAPFPERFSQNDVKTLLAHFWPAIAEHVRAELAAEFASALLAVDPVEWALAGQHAGADAAAIVRRMADATTPTSKEQQR